MRPLHILLNHRPEAEEKTEAGAWCPIVDLWRGSTNISAVDESADGCACLCRASSQHGAPAWLWGVGDVGRRRCIYSPRAVYPPGFAEVPGLTCPGTAAYQLRLQFCELMPRLQALRGKEGTMSAHMIAYLVIAICYIVLAFS